MCILVNLYTPPLLTVQTQRGVTNLKPPYVEAVPHHVEEVPPHFSQTVSFSQFPPSPETSSASTPEHNSERTCTRK